MRTSYHPCFFFIIFINFFSFFLNLDNIIIKLVNVRGTMRKEAEVNHAYILGCKSQYFLSRYLGSSLPRRRFLGSSFEGRDERLGGYLGSI